MDRLVHMESDKTTTDAATKELERELEKCEDSLKTWEQMRTVLEMLVTVKLFYTNNLLTP